MTYLLEVFDYRVSEEDSVRVRTYDSRHGLANGLKRMANDYINRIAIMYMEKPSVSIYYTSCGRATVDIYGDECIEISINLIGI